MGVKQAPPAFGFCVIVCDQSNKMYFVGVFGHFANGEDDPWLAKADRQKVPQMETAGALAALTWAMQSGAPKGTELVILPDAAYAIGALEAEFRPQSEHATNPYS